MQRQNLQIVAGCKGNPYNSSCNENPYNLKANRFKKEKFFDDVFELKNYIKSNGKCDVTKRSSPSRALGIKPYSTQTEEEFLATLSHALDNVISSGLKCSVKKEVGIAAVFEGSKIEPHLFYSGRFDFVIFERGYDRAILKNRVASFF